MHLRRPGVLLSLLLATLSLAIPAGVSPSQASSGPMTIVFQRPPESPLTLAEITGGSITVMGDVQFCAEVEIDADTVAVQIGTPDQAEACRVTGAAITFRPAHGVELLRTFDFTPGAEVVLTDFELVPEPSGPTFTPHPVGPGVHLAMWSGGTIEQAAATEPGAISLWLTIDGQLVGYVLGAPEFVNAGFLDLTAGGHIEPQTPMLLVLAG